MQSGIQSSVASNFFLDGAKIIFGSLVIGAFVPSFTAPEFPWLTFTFGVLMTSFFLILANATEANQQIT
ncbi:MAG: hypothetical protein HY007_03930 [Candidatus Sungbacteria bacterium]|nr:hypothetical protein [Candidatus Sungbacteria bacterium]